MANTKDAWLQVLEDRVAELEGKERTHRESITRAIKRFREWANDAEECDIFYDVDDKARLIADVRNTYKAVWAELVKARGELERYKDTMEL